MRSSRTSIWISCRPDQDLFDITSRVLLGLKEVLRQEQPDLVLVHGDTTTTFVAALAAYYFRIPVVAQSYERQSLIMTINLDLQGKNRF